MVVKRNNKNEEKWWGEGGREGEGGGIRNLEMTRGRREKGMNGNNEEKEEEEEEEERKNRKFVVELK